MVKVAPFGVGGEQVIVCGRRNIEIGVNSTVVKTQFEHKPFG